jgi:hypothetical protein
VNKKYLTQLRNIQNSMMCSFNQLSVSSSEKKRHRRSKLSWRQDETSKVVEILCTGLLLVIDSQLPPEVTIIWIHKVYGPSPNAHSKVNRASEVQGGG